MMVRKHLHVPKPLELIHSNMCGLVNEAFFGNNYYFLIFIDDFIIMTDVYLKIKKKEE